MCWSRRWSTTGHTLLLTVMSGSRAAGPRAVEWAVGRWATGRGVGRGPLGRWAASRGLARGPRPAARGPPGRGPAFSKTPNKGHLLQGLVVFPRCVQFGSHPCPFRAVLRFNVAAMSLLYIPACPIDENRLQSILIDNNSSIDIGKRWKSKIERVVSIDFHRF